MHFLHAVTGFLPFKTLAWPVQNVSRSSLDYSMRLTVEFELELNLLESSAWTYFSPLSLASLEQLPNNLELQKNLKRAIARVDCFTFAYFAQISGSFDLLIALR